MKHIIAVSALGAILVAGCATVATDNRYAERALEVMKASFKEKGQAGLDRINQDETQKLCSRTNDSGPLPKATAEKIEQAQLATIKYPVDGKLMGDWKAGEKIAQSGVGKQFSDDPRQPSGGNCYACHQLSKQEVAYGTIGPSLYQYGKRRGSSMEIQKYTFGKVYNAEAFFACSNMPRFGQHGILAEQQIKDVVALLLDPTSPVNQ